VKEMLEKEKLTNPKVSEDSVRDMMAK